MSSSDNRWKKGQRVSKRGEYGTLMEDEDDDGKVKAMKDDGKKWNRADKVTFLLHRDYDSDNDRMIKVSNDEMNQGGLTSNSIHQQSKDAEVTKLIDEVASLKINNNNDDQNNIDKEKKVKKVTLKDLGVCNCGEMCDTKRCLCRKLNKRCDPELCGCCTRYGQYCLNVNSGAKLYSQLKLAPSHVSNDHDFSLDDNDLKVASWNIQSFGHNKGTRVYKRTIERIAEFINVYNIDCLFIQEVIDIEAMDNLVTAINSSISPLDRDRHMSSAVVAIGEGFNRSLAARKMPPKVTEWAGVLCRNQYVYDQLVLERVDCDEVKFRKDVPLDNSEQDPAMACKYKRAPAFCTITTQNSERITFVSLHLASDSGAQMLRLNEEIRSLPDVYDYCRRKTGANNVIFVGDLNRTYHPNSNNTEYPFNGLDSFMRPVLSNVKTNTSKHDELYDNFWIPKHMTNDFNAIVATDFLAVYPEDESKNNHLSDHYPILLAIKKNIKNR
jgi:endonuclease/exonuclease/phosphatase family metal-dependent hydrolase